MTYETDSRLARLFVFRRFIEGSRPPPHDPGGPLIWSGLPIHREVRDLLRLLMRELPGPKNDVAPPWDERHQRIVEAWLKVAHCCVVALREFLDVRDRALKSVDSNASAWEIGSADVERYKTHPAALTARWILADAATAWKNEQEVQSIINNSLVGRPSARFILLLSFVPVAIFEEALPVRDAMRRRRRRFADEVIRYSNRAARVRPEDRYLLPVDEDAEAGEDASDPRADILQACSTPDDSELWRDIGLGGADSSSTQHPLWSLISLPLLEYLAPFAPARKRKPGPHGPPTPESLFALTHRLLAARAPGRAVPSPGALRSRYRHCQQPFASS